MLTANINYLMRKLTQNKSSETFKEAREVLRVVSQQILPTPIFIKIKKNKETLNYNKHVKENMSDSRASIGSREAVLMDTSNKNRVVDKSFENIKVIKCVIHNNKAIGKAYGNNNYIINKRIRIINKQFNKIKERRNKQKDL